MQEPSGSHGPVSEPEAVGENAPLSKHARVPRPIGMDFNFKPASTVEKLPSAKFAKDTVKGKLQDRLLNRGRRRGGDAQAVQLSVEGRNVDRL